MNMKTGNDCLCKIINPELRECNMKEKHNILLNQETSVYTYYYPELSKATFLPKGELEFADTFLHKLPAGSIFSCNEWSKLSQRSFNKLIIFLKKKGIIQSEFIRCCPNNLVLQALTSGEYIQIRLAAINKKQQSSYLEKQKKIDIKICGDCICQCSYRNKEEELDFQSYLTSFDEMYRKLR